MKKSSVSFVVTCVALTCSSLFGQSGGGSAGASSGPSSAGASTPATSAIPGSTSTDPGQSGIGTTSTPELSGRDMKDNPRISTSVSASRIPSTNGLGVTGSGTNGMSSSSRTGVLPGTDTRGTGLTGKDTRGQGAATVAATGSASTVSSGGSRPLNSSDDWKSGLNAGIPSTGTLAIGTDSISGSSGIGAGLSGGNRLNASAGTNGIVNSNGLASGSAITGTPIIEASGAARGNSSVVGSSPGTTVTNGGSGATSGPGK